MTIYLIYNTVNGKYYVGKTILGVKERWKQHIQDARTGCRGYFYAAIRKYGPDAFTINELCSGDNNEDLNRLERMFILAFGANKRDRGYNMTEGGDGGKTPKTPEGIEKGAAKHRGMKRNSKLLSDKARANFLKLNASLTPAQKTERGRRARAAVRNPKYPPKGRRPEHLNRITSEQWKQALQKAWATRRAHSTPEEISRVSREAHQKALAAGWVPNISGLKKFYDLHPEKHREHGLLLGKKSEDGGKRT